MSCDTRVKMSTTVFVKPAVVGVNSQWTTTLRFIRTRRGRLARIHHGCFGGGEDKHRQGHLRDQVVVLSEVRSGTRCVCKGLTYGQLIRMSYMYRGLMTRRTWALVLCPLQKSKEQSGANLRQRGSTIFFLVPVSAMAVVVAFRTFSRPEARSPQTTVVVAENKIRS